jgi:hypothetical protein
VANPNTLRTVDFDDEDDALLLASVDELGERQVRPIALVFVLS